jgi:hypothetical protein
LARAAQNGGGVLGEVAIQTRRMAEHSRQAPMTHTVLRYVADRVDRVITVYAP